MPLYSFRHFFQSAGVREFIEFEIRGTPSNPAAGRARLYFRQADANNDELAVLIRTAGAIEEVVFTSPTGKCSKCDYVGRIKDGPVWDTISQKITVKFFCGHEFEFSLRPLSLFRRITAKVRQFIRKIFHRK